MKHLFVPYEITLQLKEKEFDEPCFGYFAPLKTKLTIWYNEEITNQGSFILAPLYQQVIDWLMLKHQIKIWWIPCGFNENRLMIKGKQIFTEEGPLFYNDWHDIDKLTEGYNLAIIEALKLI